MRAARRTRSLRTCPRAPEHSGHTELARHAVHHLKKRFAMAGRGITSWRSAAKPRTRWLIGHRMLRGFVCCNGMLGGQDTNNNGVAMNASHFSVQSQIAQIPTRYQRCPSTGRDGSRVAAPSSQYSLSPTEVGGFPLGTYARPNRCPSVGFRNGSLSPWNATNPRPT
jgi:hypothetical protein